MKEYISQLTETSDDETHSTTTLNTDLSTFINYNRNQYFATDLIDNRVTLIVKQIVEFPLVVDLLG